MNLNQKKVLIAIAVVIFGMMLYPPFIGPGLGSREYYYHYDWIFSNYMYNSFRVDTHVLFAQWLGVLLVGGIIFIVLKDNKK